MDGKFVWFTCIGKDTSPIWILHAGPRIAGQHQGETNGCSLSTDQWLAGYFRGGGDVRGDVGWRAPPQKKEYSSQPSLIWNHRWYGSLMGTASKDAACVGLRHRHRQPKKNHKKNTKKIVLMLNSDTFRLKNSGGPTRDSPVLKK